MKMGHKIFLFAYVPKLQKAMKQFLLLRDNQESGPFTAAELKNQLLQSSDLIWIDGESTAWKFPAELEQFKDCINPDEEKKTSVTNSRFDKSTKPKYVFVSLPNETTSTAKKYEEGSP